MSKFSLYIISYLVFLIAGIIILRHLVRRDYLRRGKLSPLITFLQATLFFVYGGFPYLYLENDWPAIYVPGFFYISGILLIFLGLAGILYGMVRIGVLRSMGRGSPHLEGSGLYSRSRNPQALACVSYVIGFLILWPSRYAAGWAVLFLPLIHMMVLSEEEHLRRIHGQEYQDYCEKVPRYLGLRSFWGNSLD